MDEILPFNRDINKILQKQLPASKHIAENVVGTTIGECLHPTTKYHHATPPFPDTLTYMFATTYSMHGIGLPVQATDLFHHHMHHHHGTCTASVSRGYRSYRRILPCRTGPGFWGFFLVCNYATWWELQKKSPSTEPEQLRLPTRVSYQHYHKQ